MPTPTKPSATQSQPPAAGEAAHTPTPWYSPLMVSTQTTVYMAGHRMGARIKVADCGEGIEARENAAFIVRACNSHAALVAALEDARQALEVARASLKTAHHCMNSAEYSADETKFQNARDLVYTAFIGVSATQDRTASALKLTA